MGSGASTLRDWGEGGLYVGPTIPRPPPRCIDTLELPAPEDEQGDESNNTPPPKTREQMYSEHMGLFLLITFLAYPNLSKIQFESLDCSTEFDGRKYLR